MSGMLPYGTDMSKAFKRKDFRIAYGFALVAAIAGNVYYNVLEHGKDKAVPAQTAPQHPKP